ncbi:1-(5-phosphoribosyl)-5-[(5-phosphoribosylamino)methylideneamino] imidazole-4-carboxamide isomerase [Sphaerochaeta sp. PS]|uniref:1-(5-phosphoribosyl)-5-[(5- phosphoribosylamino)methylideneamino]imidazole-4- carboxamide isomerase n=1 Tax=Sphaerochaeta sp. PS TaxID=3076336 RepID=UPI0028A34328|nr:1-(5-phosphoribosyl)-5-[(5-phosphoribosylamino)methylideneamino] imidazole-4-carboxamide isomerase [Sphaerochaeta sp. PS]MDT4762529.1 1-(5-phosphoribosyl)-5-[(5-phosphoribosylamino)methylideneamino] imidazole-4-carboxamide isomerase [Sphaerochaeta sp. PS]
MDLIPAIDIIDGACVRLSQGNYSAKKQYASDPLEVAKRFEEHGIRRLHLVDLDGAKGGRIVNIRTLERIAANTSLVIDFGGGIKRSEDLKDAFAAGASMVTCGSVAANDPALVTGWLSLYGPDKLILGSDAKGGRIATHGWLETTTLEVGPFIDSYLAKGFSRVICTDIALDGMMGGPSFALYETLLANRPSLRLIASGGIASIGDLRQLRSSGLDGAIIGKALYEGAITLDELTAFREETDAS